MTENGQSRWNYTIPIIGFYKIISSLAFGNFITERFYNSKHAKQNTPPPVEVLEFTKNTQIRHLQ